MNLNLNDHSRPGRPLRSPGPMSRDGVVPPSVAVQDGHLVQDCQLFYIYLWFTRINR